MSISLAGCGQPPPVQRIFISGANQWTLAILRDGGGHISQGHAFREDRFAQIPEGTFDFEHVLDSLRTAENQNPGLKGVGCQVVFQYGKGVPDRHLRVLAPKLIPTLFGKAKEHARKSFKELDKLWAENPPTSASK